MHILESLEDFIHEFNENEEIDFAIDSIRVEFQKQHKLEQLKEIGCWKKVAKNSNILHMLKKRLRKDEVTSAYRLESHHIYYYNMQDKPKYRKAEMVIFGMKQYHKEPPPRQLIDKILTILKDVSNIDVCIDAPYKPDYETLERYFTLTPYIYKGVMTGTRYINNTGIMMIDKIIFYDKAFKNELKAPLWRIEATISIPNIKQLCLPLDELKGIVKLSWRHR